MARQAITIPVDSVLIPGNQARQNNVMDGIDELAVNMSKRGLLQPITVDPIKNSDNKYEVVMGQRRLLAAKKLGWEMIDALLYIPDDQDHETGIIIDSGSENMPGIRTAMVHADMIDLIERLFLIYGSFAAVVEKTGFPLHMVKRYSRMTRIPSNLKPLVTKNAFPVEVVIDAVDIATNPETHGINEEKAKRTAELLRPLDSAARKNAVQLALANPDTPISEIITQAKSAPKIHKHSISFDDKTHTALVKFAKDNGDKSSKPNIGQLVIEMISSDLSSRGYIK
jgi:hypothetical protein